MTVQGHNGDHVMLLDYLRHSSRKMRDDMIDTIGPVPNLTLLVAEIVMGWRAPKHNATGMDNPGAMLGGVARFTALLADKGTELFPGSLHRSTIPDFGHGTAATFRHVIPRLTGTLDMDFQLNTTRVYDDHSLPPPFVASFNVHDVNPATGERRSAAWFHAQHEQAEIAICRAALKACLYLEAREKQASQ
jgi:hypothetical protein